MSIIFVLNTAVVGRKDVSAVTYIAVSFDNPTTLTQTKLLDVNVGYSVLGCCKQDGIQVRRHE
jgi:hypothetical protein